jgi:hypothetical protein
MFGCVLFKVVSSAIGRRDKCCWRAIRSAEFSQEMRQPIGIVIIVEQN